MKALFNGNVNLPEPVYGDIFCGTSVGSLNAARMEADSVAAVAHLEEIWLNIIAEGSSAAGNGVLNFRGNPLVYLSPRAVTAPVESLAGMFRDTLFFAE